MPCKGTLPKNIYIYLKKKKNIRHYNVPIIYIPWYAIIMEGDDNCYDIKHGLKTKTEKKNLFSVPMPRNVPHCTLSPADGPRQ